MQADNDSPSFRHELNALVVQYKHNHHKEIWINSSSSASRTSSSTGPTWSRRGSPGAPCTTTTSSACSTSCTTITSFCIGTGVLTCHPDKIPSTNPGAEPPRDARNSGSARSHSTHLETSSSDRP